MAFEEDATEQFSQEVGAVEIAGDELQQSDLASKSLLDAQDAATEVASLTDPLPVRNLMATALSVKMMAG